MLSLVLFIYMRSYLDFLNFLNFIFTKFKYIVQDGNKVRTKQFVQVFIFFLPV